MAITAGVSVPRLQEIALDGWVLLFAVVLSLVTGVVFGLAPAARQALAVTLVGSAERPT